MTGSILSVRGLRKEFVLHTIDGRTVEALCDVDLDILPGEHVALAGSSGAGKSSLLKCIYRTYEPTAGSVQLLLRSGESIDLTKLPDKEMAFLRGREIGYVSQFLRAEPRRGPLDIVARAGISRGMDRNTAREAAAISLQRLNIEEKLWDIHASVLSGGEKQRINLAAGTISAPQLLLLDEPVSALDPANREAALELIGDLTAQGVAVLAVFHDIEAMERLASRIILMRNGRVEMDDQPKVILDVLAEGVHA
jgi:alpha-D-ribose 1-methylphosphonate 5-triphosphate synthase subunit PhnL